jgi:hypothetical protein
MLVITGAALTALAARILSVVRGRRRENSTDPTGLTNAAAADGWTANPGGPR